MTTLAASLALVGLTVLIVLVLQQILTDTTMYLLHLAAGTLGVLADAFAAVFRVLVESVSGDQP